MHIAIVSLGAFGHVNPTLSFTTELVKRGVRVTYFSTEDFRRIIEPSKGFFIIIVNNAAIEIHHADNEHRVSKLNLSPSRSPH